MMSSVKKSAIALGSFDGLHKGHKAVIACALSFGERGLVPTALIFDSHPLLTLTGSAPEEILQDSLRRDMLSKMGVRAVYISFSEICNYSPEMFFKKILINRLNAGAVCCGPNYRFGQKGSGDTEILRALCDEYGVELCVSPYEMYDGSPVSSSRIRTAVTSGDIKSANAMLGYEFRYCNEVKHGFRRGHLIGAPTINQYFDHGFIIPANGVYASVTTVRGEEYPSVTNIGLRPTFENEDLRSETNIIGFMGDLYGENIEVHLLDFIRSETKFDSTDALKARISADTEKSLEIFGKRGACNV